MKNKINFQERRKLADHYFKTAVILYICSAAFVIFMEIFAGSGVVYKVLSVVSIITFLAGMVFLCLANAEGTETFLAEPYEDATKAEIEELQNLLDEAKKKLSEKE